MKRKKHRGNLKLKGGGGLCYKVLSTRSLQINMYIMLRHAFIFSIHLELSIFLRSFNPPPHLSLCLSLFLSPSCVPVSWSLWSWLSVVKSVPSLVSLNSLHFVHRSSRWSFTGSSSCLFRTPLRSSPSPVLLILSWCPRHMLPRRNSPPSVPRPLPSLTPALSTLLLSPCPSPTFPSPLPLLSVLPRLLSSLRFPAAFLSFLF